MTMPSFRACLPKLQVSYLLVLAALFLMSIGLLPDAAGQAAHAQESGPPVIFQ